MTRKQYKGLSDNERSEISILKNKGYSLRAVAEVLGRSPNTVSYEIKRNSVNGVYDPLKAKAKSRANRKSRRWQWQKIEQHPQLWAFIVQKLKEHWSPDAIAGYLKHRQDELPYVSAPRIYAWLYSSRGQPYCEHLLSCRYKPKRRRPQTERVMISDRVSIAERPEIVSGRARAGDWEADTVVSGKRMDSRAALAVSQERSTRLVAAQLLPNLKPEAFSSAVTAMFQDKLALSLTLDNGIENKQHKTIRNMAGDQVLTYFCDPYSSYQKGGVEHANKMLRRYLPKGCDLNRFNQGQIDVFVGIINNKPRRCLGYKSALQCAEEKGVLLAGVS